MKAWEAGGEGGGRQAVVEKSRKAGEKVPCMYRQRHVNGLSNAN